MESYERNERGKMTAEKTLQMLKDEGVEVTLEQAGIILEFLRKLANMAVYNYLNKKDEKNSRPIREGEYR
jgi:S-adenosylmethionine:tRNA-ribosyltransferase-isomerase (queuine synthetase)